MATMLKLQLNTPPAVTRDTTVEMVNSASTLGGLMRKPRFVQIAADCTMKLTESVAMIGGMRSALMSA